MFKKIIFTIIAVVACSTTVLAQNANRNGFFLEVGAGGFAINPPVCHVYDELKPSSTGVPNSITRRDILEYVGGVQLNAGLGYRLAFSSSFAAELRAETLIDLDMDLFVIKFMPGIRYTTPEIVGNMSLYAALNAGISYCPEYDEAPIGFAGNVEFGMNFTPRFYIGAYLAMQTVNFEISSDSMWDNYRPSTFSGVLGGKIGFRF